MSMTVTMSTTKIYLILLHFALIDIICAYYCNVEHGCKKVIVLEHVTNKCWRCNTWWSASRSFIPTSNPQRSTDTSFHNSTRIVQRARLSINLPLLFIFPSFVSLLLHPLLSVTMAVETISDTSHLLVMSAWSSFFFPISEKASFQCGSVIYSMNCCLI